MTCWRTAVTSSLVLYIEDDHASRIVMSGAFRLIDGVDVVCAGSGEEGIRALQIDRPDLVLLDANLPDMSGSDVLRRIAEVVGSTRPPVVVVSADIASPRVDQMLEDGAVASLAKPLDLDQLIETVRRLVGRATPPPSRS